MSYDHDISILYLFKCNLMQLRLSFKNLARFLHEHIVLPFRLKITSCLVMSGARVDQTALSYVIKCS
jgi:hypothetical protein